MCIRDRIASLAPEPIISGYAAPGSILVGRLYDSHGAIIGETSTKVDHAGNFVLQFFGTEAHNQTTRVIIEHVATEDVSLGHSNFRLTPDTYRSMQFQANHNKKATPDTILSDAPYQSLVGQHDENTNPLKVRDE